MKEDENKSKLLENNYKVPAAFGTVKNWNETGYSMAESMTESKMLDEIGQVYDLYKSLN